MQIYLGDEQAAYKQSSTETKDIGVIVISDTMEKLSNLIEIITAEWNKLQKKLKRRSRFGSFITI